MKSRMPRLLAMESPTPNAHFMVRLLEPPGSCRKSLWERLWAGTYDKPFIIDSKLRRFLHFDLGAIQSAMHLQHPDRLSLTYTRKMMTFLLFNRAPARILLLGLGGGSLAKFCYRGLPHAAVTAVELNPDVIALRQAFCIPPDNERFRIICADGAHYVAHLERAKDVILADACDRVGIAPELDTVAFYQHARRCLSPAGVFVTNVCGDITSRATHLDKIREAFGEGFVTLQARQDGNFIVFAFKDLPPQIDWDRLQATAVELKRGFGLDFPRYLRRIKLDWQLRRWQHVFA